MRYRLDFILVSGLQLKCDLELGTQAALDAGTFYIRHLLGNGTLFLLNACSGSISQPNAATVLGFVDLADFMAQHEAFLEVDVRYFGTDNFVGEKVDGYAVEKIYATEETAAGSAIIQKHITAEVWH